MTPRQKEDPATVQDSARPRATAAAAALTVWAFVVLAAYFAMHKPGDVAQLSALLGVALTLAVPMWIWWIAAGLGTLIFDWADSAAAADGRRIVRGALERAAVGTGFGLGLMGLAVFALGLFGGFRPILFGALLLVGAVLTARRTMRVLREVGQEGLALPRGKFPHVLAVFTAIVLLLALGQALMPPIAWDGLTYHLTGPKLYIEAGRYLPGLDLPHLAFPELIEMLYTAALLLAGPSSAQVLHWGFGLLTLALLFAVGRRYFDLHVSWLAMAVLCSVPTLVLLSHWPYVDVAVGFWELASVYALLQRLDGGSRRWLVLAGAFAGFAMGTKYTAIMPALAFVLALAWHSRRQGWQCVMADELTFGGVAMLVTLPWLVKNWVYLGNPVYPFAFDGLRWDGFLRDWWARPGTGLAFKSPLFLLTAPWDMTIWGTEGKEGFQATIGPLLLVGLLALWLVRAAATATERRVLAVLGTVSVLQYAFWLAGVAWTVRLMQTRLYLPAFPLLALVVAFALSRLRALRQSSFAVDWVFKVLVVIALCLGLLSFTMEAGRIFSPAYLSGLETPAAYLGAHLGPHYAAMERMNELPPASRVVFFWEPRSFYSPRPVRPDVELDAFPHLIHRFETAESIAAYLRGEGYTHVLHYRQGMEFMRTASEYSLSDEERRIWTDFVRDHLQVVYSVGESYVVYEWQPS